MSAQRGPHWVQGLLWEKGVLALWVQLLCCQPRKGKAQPT